MGLGGIGLRPFVFALVFFTWLLLGQTAYVTSQEIPLQVTVKAGLLTVKATDVPLARVLQKISRQVDLRVYGESRLANEKITVEFHDLAIQEGLDRILNRYNSAYVFSTAPRRLAEVWLFSRAEDVSPGLKASEKGFELVNLSGEKMDSPDPSIRRRAVDAIGESPDPKVIPVLLNFLKDPDRAVRLAAIDALSDLGPLVPVERLAESILGHEDPQTRMAALESGLALPHEAIKRLALHDPAPEVRLEALHSLEGKKGIEEVASQALKDPDPSVQAMAREILQTVEEETNPSARQPEGLREMEGDEGNGAGVEEEGE